MISGRGTRSRAPCPRRTTAARSTLVQVTIRPLCPQQRRQLRSGDVDLHHDFPVDLHLNAVLLSCLLIRGRAGAVDASAKIPAVRTHWTVAEVEVPAEAAVDGRPAEVPRGIVKTWVTVSRRCCGGILEHERRGAGQRPRRTHARWTAKAVTCHDSNNRTLRHRGKSESLDAIERSRHH
jgi:hypothetical protein